MAPKRTVASVKIAPRARKPAASAAPDLAPEAAAAGGSRLREALPEFGPDQLAEIARLPVDLLAPESADKLAQVKKLAAKLGPDEALFALRTMFLVEAAGEEEEEQAPAPISAEGPAARVARCLPELTADELDAVRRLPFDLGAPENATVLFEVANMVRTIGAGETLHFLASVQTPQDVFWLQPILGPVRALAREEIELRTAQDEGVKGGVNCRRCGSDRVMSSERQTRGLDEATTFSYQCTACGNRWKS